MTIYFIFLGYLFQMLVCSVINLVLETRIPVNRLDFFKLTFLPWLLLNINKLK